MWMYRWTIASVGFLFTKNYWIWLNYNELKVTILLLCYFFFAFSAQYIIDCAPWYPKSIITTQKKKKKKNYVPNGKYIAWLSGQDCRQDLGWTTPELVPWALVHLEMTCCPDLSDLICMLLKVIPVQATDWLQLRLIATYVLDVPTMSL